MTTTCRYNEEDEKRFNPVICLKGNDGKSVIEEDEERFNPVICLKGNDGKSVIEVEIKHEIDYNSIR
jgi:hypothetical protein